MGETNELLKGKNEITYSELHQKLIEDNVTQTERLLVARIIKDLSIREQINIPMIVFCNDIYIDLENKQPREKF